MTLSGVGVEKVTSISGLRISRSMLEGSIRHALFDSDRWRPVDHDGATRPFRSAVLLLPPGRPDPRNPPAAADRKTHQLCLCAGEVEAELQRNRPSVNRSRTAAAHPLDRVFVWHHQRTEAGGGTGMHLAWRWFTG